MNETYGMATTCRHVPLLLLNASRVQFIARSALGFQNCSRVMRKHDRKFCSHSTRGNAFIDEKRLRIEYGQTLSHFQSRYSISSRNQLSELLIHSILN